MSKVIHFIKYHNAASISVSVLLLVMGSAFAASPEVRDIIVDKTETIRSVDNTRILSADLNNFNPYLHITDITEDNDNFYITYTYKTIAIVDYIWQDITQENTLTVPKKSLGEGQDLGLYIAEELGEVIDFKLSYLQEVQDKEKKAGETPKLATIEYAGLVGRFLNPQEKEFPGYDPVRKPEPRVEAEPEETGLMGEKGERGGDLSLSETTGDARPSTIPRSKLPPPPSFDQDDLRRLVQEEVQRVLTDKLQITSTKPQTNPNDQNSNEESVPEPAEPTSEPVSETGETGITGEMDGMGIMGEMGATTATTTPIEPEPTPPQPLEPEPAPEPEPLLPPEPVSETGEMGTMGEMGTSTTEMGTMGETGEMGEMGATSTPDTMATSTPTP